MNWLSFFVGMLVGWVVEFIVDFFFWRRRYQGSASEARLRIEIAQMEAKLSETEARLIGCQEDQEGLRACQAELAACQATVGHLRELPVLMEAESARPHAALSTPEVTAEPEISVSPSMAPAVPDALGKIEGIGPKISEVLIGSGIRTFAQLAEMEVTRLAGILEDAGPRYRLADPASWPAQARLAAAGDWDALRALQDKLKGGRHQPL